MDPDAEVSVHLTLGVMFIGIALSSVLYGVACNQAIFYFRRFRTDKWMLRTAVASVWFLESLNTAFSMHAFLILAMSQRGAPRPRLWSLSIQSSTHTLAGSIIQLFFAWRVWIMSDRSIPLTGTIVSLSLAQCALGQVVTIFGLAPFLANPYHFTAILPISFGFIAITDVVIALSLCYYLHIRKSGDVSTNSIVNRLIVMTINCGVLSSSLALGALITFLTVPDTMIPIFCCMLLGKAYANTFFANLNSRSFARRKLLSHVSVSVDHTTAAPHEDVVTSDNITSITTRQRRTTLSQLTIPPFDGVLVISERSNVKSNP